MSTKPLYMNPPRAPKPIADGRLRPENRERKQIIGAAGAWLDRVYCESCHRDMGAVTPGALHAVITCDDCARYGSVPEPALPELPPEIPLCVRCKRPGEAGPPGTKYICPACFEEKGLPLGFVLAVEPSKETSPTALIVQEKTGG